VKVVKNKCAPPFRQAEFDILYDEGISHTSLLVDLGVEHNIVEKSGSWFSYGDLRLGQGKDNSRMFLKENPDIADEIETRLRVTLGLSAAEDAEAASEDEGGAAADEPEAASAASEASAEPAQAAAD
jgi:recombination protein RecA